MAEQGTAMANPIADADSTPTRQRSARNMRRSMAVRGDGAEAEAESEALRRAKALEELDRMEDGQGAHYCWPKAASRAQGVHMLASGEGSSLSARAVDGVSSVATVIAVVLSILPTEEAPDAASSQSAAGGSALHSGIELVCMVFFGLEYAVRLATAKYAPSDPAQEADDGSSSGKPQRPVRRFLLKPMNVIDLLAVAPYWVEIFVIALGWLEDGTEDWTPIFRLFRLVRVIRVLKLTQYSDALSIFIAGLGRTRDYLLSLAVLLGAATVLGGTLLFHVEGATHPETYSSVPNTFEFILAELTTVGSEQSTAQSIGGAWINVVMMMAGVVFLGYGQAILVHGFDQVLREHRRTNNIGREMKKIFRSLPAGPDGRVSCGVLYRGLARYDAALATILEPFPPEMAISYRTFKTIMREEQAKNDKGHAAVDLDSVYSAIELLSEDQAMMQDRLVDQETMIAEQSRVLNRIASHLNIDTSSDTLPLPKDKEYHFFISHAQSTGGDQANLIATNLEKRGAKVWYDQSATTITATSMEDGVRRSVVLLLLLTEGTLSRPFCQKEIRWARQYEVEIVGVYEADARRGAVDFVEEQASAPSDLQSIFEEVEFLAFRRRVFEANTMYDEIMRRGKFAEAEA